MKRGKQRYMKMQMFFPGHFLLRPLRLGRQIKMQLIFFSTRLKTYDVVLLLLEVIILNIRIRNIYMNISVVIPNFNGENLLKKNLPKVVDGVREYKNGKVEIIITDDSSKDSSLEVIEKFIQSLQGTNITGK